MNTTEAKTKTCQTCAYWESSSHTGECRRHAPQNIAFEVNDKISIESRFPMTEAASWCGDHAEK